MTEQVLQRHTRTAFPARGLVLLFALLGQVAGRAFVLHHAELETGLGNAVESQHLHGHRRPGFLQALTLFVDQRAGAAVELAADDDVALLERAFADQHRRRRAARFQAGLDHVPLARRV
jgi:hypothetical protein